MRLLIAIFVILNIAYASQNTFILNHSGLVDQRAYIKINEIGLEVKNKLNTQIYLDIKGDNGIDLKLDRKSRISLMKKIEKKLIEQVKKDSNFPFIILTFALDQQHANILYSNDELKTIVDRDEILDGYVIPLLAAKDKNILKSKVSAASLNGYAQIADSLAKHNNIELVSSIGSSGKVASTIWKMVMYTVVLFGIIAYFIIILRERKIKNGNK